MFSLLLVAFCFWREPKARAVLWDKFGVREKRCRMQGGQAYNSFKIKNCKETQNIARETGLRLYWVDNLMASQMVVGK